MNKVAFLTMGNLDGFYTYDHLLHEPMRQKGWEVIPVAWRDPDIDWNGYKAVIIRSPWDYQDDPEQFMALLETIDRSTAHLENSLELVKWNFKKTYLLELEQQGIPIVPTVHGKNLREVVPKKFFDLFGTDEIVLKPAVGANSDDTYRLNRDTLGTFLPELIKKFRDREFVVQPFKNKIVTEGEYSLFFFERHFSHTILKTPKEFDFRVQEEHGGILQKAEADEQMLEIGQKVLDTLPSTPLYARIDLVSNSDNSYSLMEVELIEPSLYFNLDPESPRLFAEVFDRRMKKVGMLPG